MQVLFMALRLSFYLSHQEFFLRLVWHTIKLLRKLLVIMCGTVITMHVIRAVSCYLDICLLKDCYLSFRRCAQRMVLVWESFPSLWDIAQNYERSLKIYFRGYMRWKFFVMSLRLCFRELNLFTEPKNVNVM